MSGKSANKILVSAGIFCSSLISSQALGVYAQSIHQFNPGDPNWPAAPIENILGEPDTGDNWRECQGGIGHNGSDFFLVCELAKGGTIDAPVPLFTRDMDLGASGLSQARYLKIIDTGTDEQYKGLELNAIEGVPEPATVFLLGLGAVMLRKTSKHNK